LLTNITLYWATGAIGSSFWPYYARAHSPWPIPQDARIAAPTGYAQFPKEILRPPRSLAERTYANIQRWTEMKKGRALRGARTARGLGARNTGVLQAAPLDRFAGSQLGRSGAARTTTTPRPPFYRAKRAVRSNVGECWHGP